MKNPKKNTNTL